MCGIAGAIATSRLRWIDDAEEEFVKPLNYRGRDDHGKWTDEQHAVLFHKRLSIIDLKEGHQPMTDTDGRLVIVFNGEIYNYLELRKEYSALGAKFRTKSDTEVILEGYKQKGENVVKDFVGMFAFAVWDKHTKSLFVARDHLGKKPLYYTVFNETFYFSSSIKSFMAIPRWSRKLSNPCLEFYTAAGSFPVGYTAFENAFEVPAGHAGMLTSGSRPSFKPYWALDFSEKVRSSQESALREYEYLLTQAVKVRLRADVPVALTFSGGVDSGSIAAIASTKLNTNLECYTIDYHTKEAPSAETEIAEIVARRLTLAWRFLQFDYRQQMLPALDSVLQNVDQPCNNLVISYSTQLYHSIKPHAKVVLSGNGADELFLGYDGNESLLRTDKKQNRSSLAALRGFLTGQGSGVDPRYLAKYQCDYLRGRVGRSGHTDFVDHLISAVFQGIVASGVRSHADLYTYMGLTYYTRDGNFRVPDIAGLTAQVEVRSPFLDHRLVDFAAKLPTSLKIGTHANGSRNKLLPKLYYEKYVPEEIAWTKKKGMGWNIKYGDSFAFDAAFRMEFEDALMRIAEIGMDSSGIRCAWEEFTRDKTMGVLYPPSGGLVFAGFMLGRWLKVSGIA